MPIFNKNSAKSDTSSAALSPSFRVLSANKVVREDILPPQQYQPQSSSTLSVNAYTADIRTSLGGSGRSLSPSGNQENSQRISPQPLQCSPQHPLSPYYKTTAPPRLNPGRQDHSRTSRSQSPVSGMSPRPVTKVPVPTVQPQQQQFPAPACVSSAMTRVPLPPINARQDDDALTTQHRYLHPFSLADTRHEATHSQREEVSDNAPTGNSVTLQDGAYNSDSFDEDEEDHTPQPRTQNRYVFTDSEDEEDVPASATSPPPLPPPSAPTPSPCDEETTPVTAFMPRDSTIMLVPGDNDDYSPAGYSDPPPADGGFYAYSDYSDSPVPVHAVYDRSFTLDSNGSLEEKTVPRAQRRLMVVATTGGLDDSDEEPRRTLRLVTPRTDSFPTAETVHVSTPTLASGEKGQAVGSDDPRILQVDTTGTESFPSLEPTPVPLPPPPPPAMAPPPTPTPAALALAPPPVITRSFYGDDDAYDTAPAASRTNFNAILRVTPVRNFDSDSDGDEKSDSLSSFRSGSPGVSPAVSSFNTSVASPSSITSSSRGSRFSAVLKETFRSRSPSSPAISAADSPYPIMSSENSLTAPHGVASGRRRSPSAAQQLTSVHVPQDLPVAKNSVLMGRANTQRRIEHGGEWEERAVKLATNEMAQLQISAPRSTASLPLPLPSPTATSEVDEERMAEKEEELLQKAIELHEQNKLAEATAIFGKIADSNGPQSPIAQLLYGLSLRHGWGVPANPERAIQYLRYALMTSAAVEDAALRANVKVTKRTWKSGAGGMKGELSLALFELANCFRYGWGVEVDSFAAKSYYENAANLGDLDALRELAWCYLEGFGCQKNKFQAAQYYRQAVEQGKSEVGDMWIWKDKYNDTPENRARVEKELAKKHLFRR
ncbi:uncharacterized protein V1518DRAFT_411171 [Limtongia smithiae]|uniref:uncharacterized protein n=1 Tax=Limtongia smithiae TaxID=1125753 RepID=UPI0034CDCFB9